YFLRDFPDNADVQALRPEDWDLGRIQLKEPGPIPEHEARWAWDWMASWGLLSGPFDAASQINRRVERLAHEAAAPPSPPAPPGVMSTYFGFTTLVGQRRV